ncbi:hypothetical protein MHK_001053, partial [Candidatus Magnetomorum sp. HK-1]
MTLQDSIRKYIKAGDAESDRQKNLYKWRKNPTEYRIINLRDYYINTNNYKKIEELSFDPQFILNLSNYSFGNPDVYKIFAKNFFKGRASSPEKIARVSIIEYIFQSLTLDKVRGTEIEVARYVSDRFSDNVRIKFCYLLIIYVKRLVLYKKTSFEFYEYLKNASKLLLINLKNENERHGSFTSDGEQLIEKKEIIDLIKICLQVIIDYNDQIIFLLIDCSGIDKFEVIESLATYLKPHNELFAKEVITYIGGPKRLNEFDSIQNCNEYPILNLFKKLEIITLYDKICCIDKNDLQTFEKELIWLLSNTDVLKKNKELWKVFYQGNIIQFISNKIDLIIFEDINISKRTKEFFEKIAIDHFNYEMNESTISPFEYCLSKIIERSELSNFDDTISSILNDEQWYKLNTISKLWILAFSTQFSKPKLTYKIFKKKIKLIGIKGSWKYMLLFFYLVKLLKKLDEKKIKKENQQGFYKFDKYYFSDMAKLAKSVFIGNTDILVKNLIGAKIRQLKLISLFKKSKINRNHAIKTLKKICKKNKNGFTNTIDIERCRQYDKSLPYNINRPKKPIWLPLKHYKRVRSLFSPYKNDRNFKELIRLVAPDELHGYEYTIPSKLYMRYIRLPGSFFEKKLEFSFNPILLFRAILLRESLVFYNKLYYYYRKNKDIKKYVNNFYIRFAINHLIKEDNPKIQINLTDKYSPP